MRLLGSRGNLRRIAFREGGRAYECLVPDDALWSAVKDVLVLREYERASITLARCRGTVVDAGAHVGLFSLQAAAHADQVIAIEPHPRNYGLLRANLAMNTSANVEPLERALWSSPGNFTLIEGRDSVGASVVPSDLGHRGIEVTSVTLDDLIADTGHVDLLKLDIEGAEINVLQSAQSGTLRKVSSLAAEVHSEASAPSLNAVRRRLIGLGFRVKLLKPPIHYWGQSTMMTFRTWSKSSDLVALKSAVILAYTAKRLESTLTADSRVGTNLCYLYATR